MANLRLGCDELSANGGFRSDGRGIVTAEAFVGRAHSVYVGTIQALAPVESKVPIDTSQHYGNTYKLTFNVTEAIRGQSKAQLAIILLLQHTIYLDYFREHHTELAIAIGNGCKVSDIGSEDVVEVDGQILLGESIQYRILDRLPQKDQLSVGVDARQFNVSMDEGKMFDFRFGLLTSRNEVLRHFRAFAKKHQEISQVVWVMVPHGFGRLCGYTNAYMVAGFPVCPETKATLEKMVNHPEKFLSRYDCKDPDLDRKILVNAGKKGLIDFVKS